MNSKEFAIYFNDLQVHAKRDGVRVCRADEYAIWNSHATQELIDAVRAYAIAHYQRDGWDYVVESYSDSQIADLIKTARTAVGAIKMVRTDCKARADYRAEIQAEAF
jgi:DNA-binding LytR/AlgR family response regulator